MGKEKEQDIKVCMDLLPLSEPYYKWALILAKNEHQGTEMTAE